MSFKVREGLQQDNDQTIIAWICCGGRTGPAKGWHGLSIFETLHGFQHLKWDVHRFQGTGPHRENSRNLELEGGAGFITSILDACGGHSDCIPELCLKFLGSKV